MPEDPLAPLAAKRPVLRAVARTVVPEASSLEEEGWRELEAIVGEALHDRPPGLLRRLRLLLGVVHWLPVLRWGRPFPELSADARRRFLAALQEAPVLRVRQGFWGLRTLCFMGYYGREAVHDEIGYDARLRGRRDRGTPTRGGGRGELLAETPRERP